MADNLLKYLDVRIGSQWYGINVDQVIEVFHLVAFTELPTVSNEVLGLITVRDQVMPLLDLRRRLGAETALLKLDTIVVAVREANGSLALVFDDADRVEDIPESQVTAAMNPQQFPYISAVARLSARVLLLLDTKSISEEWASFAGH